MPEELTPLPCPFCGNHNVVAEPCYLTCQSCKADGPMMFDCPPEKAVANWNRRAQPDPQAFPPITEQQSQWGRLYTAANALVVQMGYHGSMQADSIEMESLKDKLHDLDGGEWMPGLMPPAQPVAPADAAPSVAPEPESDLEYLKGRDEHYTKGLNSVFETTKSAEYVIAAAVAMLANKDNAERWRAAHPPRAPLTDDEVDLLWRKAYADHCGTTMSFDWFEAGVRALEVAHGISAEGAAK